MIAENREKVKVVMDYYDETPLGAIIRALRGLRHGQLIVVVEDGFILDIDRIETKPSS